MWVITKRETTIGKCRISGKVKAERVLNIYSRIWRCRWMIRILVLAII